MLLLDPLPTNNNIYPQITTFTPFFTRSLSATAILCLASCTVTKVSPIPASEKVSHVIIRKNPKVIVSDFLPVVEDGFSRNGITTSIQPENTQTGNAYTVDYVAYKTWDLVTYMHQANVTVSKNGVTVGKVDYHLRNKGGYALTKFAGTRSKMDPLMDTMLAGVKKNR